MRIAEFSVTEKQTIPPSYLPTPAEIKSQCEQIRRTWSKTTFAKRRGPHLSWCVPRCRTPAEAC